MNLKAGRTERDICRNWVLTRRSGTRWPNFAYPGGLSHADSFEVFPEIEPDREGRFETRFVLHGLRHLNKHAVERSESLRVGDALRLSFELNNPATSHAILVSSDDYYMLGWLPRYLVDCMHRDGAWLVEDVEVSVAKVNLYAPFCLEVWPKSGRKGLYFW